MKATDRSPESFNGMPMRLETVDKFVFEGLQRQFMELFNSPSAWVTSTDKVAILDRMFGGPTGQKVSRYPYVFLTLNSWELTEDRHSNRLSSLFGTQISLSTDKKTSVRVRYLPANFSVEVEYVTNAYADVMDYARRWMFASKRGGFNFQVAYGQTRFDIKVIPDSTISFPKREADPENVQEYVAQSNLIMQAFISEAEPVQQHSADTVELELRDGTVNPNAVIWKFRSTES